MFIATRCRAHELRQEFNVPVRTSRHFTPDGVSRPRSVIAINMALLAEGQPPTEGLYEKFVVRPSGGSLYPALGRITNI